jgi:HEAT repeat protein
MGQRLTALVRGCTDLPLLDYVIDNLPKGLPPQVVSHQSRTYLQTPWLAALERKCELLGEPFVELTKYLQQEEFTQLQRERAALLRDKVQSLRALAREQEDVLRRQLRDPEPATRLEAIEAVSMARRTLETELIERLDDPDADVRQAARRALVRLARGTDFGPRTGASKRLRRKAQQRWLEWLVLQDDKQRQTALKPGLLALQPEGRLVAGDDGVARRVEDFLAASAARREELLIEWRDSKGGEYTDTLAYTIPQLSEAMQAKARQALAERLTRMTAGTLRTMLRDEDAEIRRAAALACGKKKVRDHIPDVLPLLEDEEPMVARAARGTLKALSGEDFGPRPDAGRPERMLAVAAWKAWWAKERKKER